MVEGARSPAGRSGTERDAAAALSGGGEPRRQRPLRTRAPQGLQGPRGARSRLHGEGSIRERADGRWEVRLSVGGRRQSWYAPDRETALRLLAELRGRQVVGRLPRPSDLTVGRYLEDWLAAHSPTLRPSSAEAYGTKLARLRSLFSIRLQRLEARHLAACYAALLRQGLAPDTVRASHLVLHKALADATRWGLLGQNPADLVHPPRPRARALPWGLREARAFVVHALRVDTPAARLFVFLATSGLRLGEALGLRWSDVTLPAVAAQRPAATDTDTEPGTPGPEDPEGEMALLRVERALTRVRGGYVSGPPKTEAGRRALHLPPTAVQVLVGQRRWQERVGIGLETRSWIWTTARGTPLDRSALRRAFRRLCTEAGVPLLRIHDLRAVNATLLLGNGVDAKEVQRRLGHASLRLTLGVYARAVPEADSRAALRLEQALMESDGR